MVSAGLSGRAHVSLPHSGAAAFVACEPCGAAPAQRSVCAGVFAMNSAFSSEAFLAGFGQNDLRGFHCSSSAGDGVSDEMPRDQLECMCRNTMVTLGVAARCTRCSNCISKKPCAVVVQHRRT